MHATVAEAYAARDFSDPRVLEAEAWALAQEVWRWEPKAVIAALVWGSERGWSHTFYKAVVAYALLREWVEYYTPSWVDRIKPEHLPVDIVPDADSGHTHFAAGHYFFKHRREVREALHGVGSGGLEDHEG